MGILPSSITEGIYRISNFGNLVGWSLKLKKPQVHKDGYHYYLLSFSGQRLFCKAHTLVAWAFIGPPPKGMDRIRHLDGNPSNNHVSNLVWGDVAANAADVPYEKRGTRTKKHIKRDAKILHLHRSGKDKHQIASEVGLPYYRVRDIIRCSILEEGGQALERKIMEMHNSGFKSREIGQETGLTTQMVTIMIHRLKNEEDERIVTSVGRKLEELITDGSN